MSGSGILYRAFVDVATRQDQCVAIIAENRNLTYRTLRVAIDDCAAAMFARGIREGHLIGINVTRPELYLIVLFAASKIGTSVVFASFADVERLSGRVDFLLADDRMAPHERSGALVIDQSWFTARPDARTVPTADGAAMRIVFGTSGSTGHRKFVAVPEGELLKRLEPRSAYIGPHTRLLCTIGARTAVTIESRVMALLSGGSVVVLPISPDTPHFIDLFAVNTMMTTPLILEDLIKLDYPKKLYWSLKKLTIGGASPASALMETVADRVCDDITIGYGNTELGSITHYSYVKDDYRIGMVGKVLAGIEVAIVDDDGRAVDAGTVGQIRIRRAGADSNVTYASADDVGTGRFVDGWFLPGDRGWLDTNGNLIIAGRDDDVINAGGNKYSLDLIESEIEAKQDCRCVVLRGDKTDRGDRIVVLVDAQRPVAATDIVRFMESRFRRVEIGAIHTAPEIKTTDGKKDRVEMARLFQANPSLFGRVWPER